MTFTVYPAPYTGNLQPAACDCGTISSNLTRILAVDGDEATLHFCCRACVQDALDSGLATVCQ